MFSANVFLVEHDFPPKNGPVPSQPVNGYEIFKMMRDRSPVEPAILGLIATAAVGGVITDLGVPFWAAWFGVAGVCFLGVKWLRTRMSGE
jgi:hypothetical protein